MAKAELKHTVKQFHDEDTKANQLVILETDPEQKFWLTIQHAGNAFSTFEAHFQQTGSQRFGMRFA